MGDENKPTRNPPWGTQNPGRSDCRTMRGETPANGYTPAVDVADADLVYQGRFISRPRKAVIEALINIEEGESTDLPEVYQTVDLDALDQLYQNPDQMQYPAEVSFCVGHYRFFISSDGLIDVYDLSGLPDFEAE